MFFCLFIEPLPAATICPRQTTRVLWCLSRTTPRPHRICPHPRASQAITLRLTPRTQPRPLYKSRRRATKKSNLWPMWVTMTLCSRVSRSTPSRRRSLAFSGRGISCWAKSGAVSSRATNRSRTTCWPTFACSAPTRTVACRRFSTRPKINCSNNL